MKIRYVKAETSASVLARRNYGKRTSQDGRADVETVDSAQKSQGEVTKQMCAKLYNYKRLFMLQMALLDLSFCTMFLDLAASLRVFSRAGKSAFVTAEEYHHTVNNLGAGVGSQWPPPSKTKLQEAIYRQRVGNHLLCKMNSVCTGLAFEHACFGLSKWSAFITNYEIPEAEVLSKVNRKMPVCAHCNERQE